MFWNGETQLDFTVTDYNDPNIVTDNFSVTINDLIGNKVELKELNIKYFWRGKGINEKCYDDKGNSIIECDKEYFRPLEVDTLLGDSSKARKELNWKPKYNITKLVKEMISIELNNLNKV